MQIAILYRMLPKSQNRQNASYAFLDYHGSINNCFSVSPKERSAGVHSELPHLHWTWRLTVLTPGLPRPFWATHSYTPAICRVTLEIVYRLPECCASPEGSRPTCGGGACQTALLKHTDIPINVAPFIIQVSSPPPFRTATPFLSRVFVK